MMWVRMSHTPHAKYRHVYAIVRVDQDTGSDLPLEERISVTKILWTEEDAMNEVKRLTDLNAGKGCRYLWLLTHLHDEPGMA
jgi:hypothetical protein